jgi:hypothetical protein
MKNFITFARSKKDKMKNIIKYGVMTGNRVENGFFTVFQTGGGKKRLCYHSANRIEGRKRISSISQIELPRENGLFSFRKSNCRKKTDFYHFANRTAERKRISTILQP